MVNNSALITLLILFVFLAGCASIEDNIPAEREQELSPSPAVSISADTVDAPEPGAESVTGRPDAAPEALSIEDVWGDVEIKHMDWSTSVALDISDAGDLLIGYYGDSETSPRQLMTVNIHSGDETIVCEMDFPWQASYGLINDDWIIYRVTSSYDFYGSDYEIYTYNRESGETSLLCEAPTDENGDLVSFYSPNFSLRGNSLLIDEISEQDENSSVVTSYEYDLETGERTILAEQFAMPRHADGFVIGLCEDRNQTDKTKNYSIICKLENGEITPVTEKGTRVFDYAVDGYDSAMIIAQNLDSYGPGEAFLYQTSAYLIEGSGEIITLHDASEDSRSCDWPDLSREIAVWHCNQNAFAYDRVLGQTVQLTYDGTSNVLATDKYILWTQRSEENTSDFADELCIIEVSSFPGR